MPQLFKPKANTIAKLGVMAGAGVPVLAILIGSAISQSPANTRARVALDQPVPFSHKHHAWELGIDCRYCHISVEDSAKAGLPSTETCMTCHSQIWTNSPLLEPVRQSYAENKPLRWVQLNKVPEFVYFNHSIHVNKGISCNNCHGAVQDMQMAYKARTLFMRWCLNCHDNPEKYLWEDKKNPQLSPREQVFNLYMKYQVDPKMQNASKVEQQLAFGNEQRLPEADQARGVELLKERKINKSQLSNCSVCHH